MASNLLKRKQKKTWNWKMRKISSPQFLSFIFDFVPQILDGIKETFVTYVLSKTFNPTSALLFTIWISYVYNGFLRKHQTLSIVTKHAFNRPKLFKQNPVYHQITIERVDISRIVPFIPFITSYELCNNNNQIQP